MNMKYVTNNPMIIEKGYPNTVIISKTTLKEVPLSLYQVQHL